MKRRFVRMVLGPNGERPFLICRARCTPPRRRNPIDGYFAELRDDEHDVTPDGKIKLKLDGRFKRFCLRPLAHATRIETQNSSVNEMLDWLEARDAYWSFEYVGEQKETGHGKGPKKVVVAYPTFSFHDPVIAVEFKLAHG